jgi:hypothetical protein
MLQFLKMDGYLLRYALVTIFRSENFATNYRAVIRDYDCIPSVAEDGKVSFVSIDDVVPPACRALLDVQSHNREQVIVGPELLTYDQVRHGPLLRSLFSLETDGTIVEPLCRQRVSSLAFLVDRLVTDAKLQQSTPNSIKWLDLGKLMRIF